MGGISNYHLQGMTKPAKRTIDADRLCARCGYSLQGLPPSGRCPECGTPIRTDQKIDDVLSQMPMHVIRAFTIGSLVAAGVVLLAAVAIVGLYFGAYPKWVGPGALALLSLAWVYAVFALTPAMHVPQAMIRGFKEGGRLRVAARASQLIWPIAAGCLVALEVSTLKPIAVDALWTAARWSVCLGLIGIVPLSIMLERLAEWARDDGTEKCFNWAVWAVPSTSILLLIDIPIRFATFIALLACVASVVVFLYGIVSLGRSIALTNLHARENQDIHMRRFERAQEFGEDVVESVQRMDQAAEQRQSLRSQETPSSEASSVNLPGALSASSAGRRTPQTFSGSDSQTPRKTQ